MREVELYQKKKLVWEKGTIANGTRVLVPTLLPKRLGMQMCFLNSRAGKERGEKEGFLTRAMTALLLEGTRGKA